jgi:chaperonin GroES
MKLRPLFDRVVIRRLDEDSVSTGGIYIPDTAKEKPDQGEVVAVGAGKLNKSGERVPMELKIGQRVLFGKYSGTNVKIDNEELVVMREDDVLAIVEGKAGKK